MHREELPSLRSLENCQPSDTLAPRWLSCGHRTHLDGVLTLIPICGRGLYDGKALPSVDVVIDGYKGVARDPPDARLRLFPALKLGIRFLKEMAWTEGLPAIQGWAVEELVLCLFPEDCGRTALLEDVVRMCMVAVVNGHPKILEDAGLTNDTWRERCYSVLKMMAASENWGLQVVSTPRPTVSLHSSHTNKTWSCALNVNWARG